MRAAELILERIASTTPLEPRTVVLQSELVVGDPATYAYREGQVVTVLTVTLNAAIDKRYDVTAVTVGEVQRVARVRASAGGKGLNVARGARLCGQEVIATGFVAGFAGQFITSQVAAQGIRDEFVRVPGESRTCINIIDADGASTEFLEPGRHRRGDRPHAVYSPGYRSLARGRRGDALRQRSLRVPRRRLPPIRGGGAGWPAVR